MSYNVTLTSSDGITLQSLTTDTAYNFTNVETLNGMFSVTVFAMTENTSGGSIMAATVIDILPDGWLLCTCIYTYVNAVW